MEAKDKGKILYSIDVTLDEHPRVKYFLDANGKPNANGQGNGNGSLVEVTGNVARLQILPDEAQNDGAHFLKRLDKNGQQVWQTRHPSLQETFWHAEWEYEVKEDEWKKT